MLTDQAKAQMAELRAKDRGGAWIRGETELVDPAFGVRHVPVEEVTVGCQVWTDIEKRRTWRDEPVGGVVLDVIPPQIDPDTGEVGLPRRFLVIDPLVRDLRDAFAVVKADQVTPDGTEAPDRGTIARVVRRFAHELAARLGPLNQRDVELCAHMHALVAAHENGVL